MGVEIGGRWRVEHTEIVVAPFAHARRVVLAVAEEIIHLAEEIEHARMRQQALGVERGNVLAANLADEGQRVVVGLALVLILGHRVGQRVGQVGTAPHLRLTGEVLVGWVENELYSHG